MALDPSALETSNEDFDFARFLGPEPEAETPPTPPKSPDTEQPSIEALQAKLAETQAALDKVKGFEGLDPDDVRLAVAEAKARAARGPEPPKEAAPPNVGLENMTPEQVQNFLAETDAQMKVNPSRVLFGAMAQVVTALRKEIQDAVQASPVAGQVIGSAIRDFKRDASSDKYTGRLFQAGEKRFDELVSQYDPKALARATRDQLDRTLQACRDAAIGYASGLSVKSALDKQRPSGGQRQAPLIGGRSSGGETTRSDDPLAQLITVLGKNSKFTDDEIAALIAEE